MEFRHGGAIFILNLCLLFSALFLLRIMLLSLHSNVLFVVDHYDRCFCLIAGFLLAFDAISEQYFGGGADLWIMCCWRLFAMNVCFFGICVTCSYFLLIGLPTATW